MKFDRFGDRTRRGRQCNIDGVTSTSTASGTSLFSSRTKINVGPGFTATLLPGYPSNPAWLILESDYTGKEMEEIAFSDDGGLRIGRFKAY
ncbi:uncharacterized protein K444DRAFT_611474, partial [Hyaloscypha bicolor E]